jgi:hypothetical protein
MKRFLILALPIVMTSLVLGLGFFLFRTRGVAIETRFGAIRDAVAKAVEEQAEQVAEVLE